MESTTPPRLRRGGVVDGIEMSDGLSVHCVDTTDVVAVDTAHTKDVLSADATDFMSAHTTQSWRDQLGYEKMVGSVGILENGGISGDTRKWRGQLGY